MPLPAETIKELIHDAFPEAQVELVDLAGDNDHWQLTVISGQFRGKSRVAQHQMVYAALKGHMGVALHALALKTSAPT